MFGMLMSKKNTMKAGRLGGFSGFVRGHFLLVAGVVCVLCSILCLFMFLPGGFSPDAGNQLDQALGLTHLSTWHPVIMSLYWRFLLLISGESVAMLCLMRVLVFWLGIFLIVRFIYYKTSNKRLALLPIILGLLPNVLVILHFNWKDSELASYLLLAFGIVISISIMSTAKKWQRILKALLLIVSFGLMLYAILVRTNGIFAVVPIFVLWFDQVIRLRWRSVMGLWYYVGVAGIAFLVSFAANQTLTLRFQPKIATATISMYVYDIVNILPKNQIKNLNISDDLKTALLGFASGNCSHFNDGGFNVVFWDKACSSGASLTGLQKHSSMDELTDLWKNTIAKHPDKWLAYSFTTYANWLTSGSYMPSFYGKYMSKEGVSIRPRSVYGQRILQVYNDNFGNKWLGLLYEKWFYLLLCILLLFVAIKNTALKNRRIILCLLSSSLLYILTYTPAALTPDYRYIFWTVISSLLGLILILCQVDWRYFNNGLKRVWKFKA